MCCCWRLFRILVRCLGTGTCLRRHNSVCCYGAPKQLKPVPAADALQCLPLVQHLGLHDNPTTDLAAFRVIELLRVIPTLADVELNVASISATTAQEVLNSLQRDPLRCMYLRRACQQRVEDCADTERGLQQALERGGGEEFGVVWPNVGPAADL